MKRNPDLECLITPLPPPVRLVSLCKGSFGLISQKIGYISFYLLTNDIHKWIILIFIHLAKKDKRKEICYTNINNECIFLAVQCQFENCFICIYLICQKSKSETYGLSPSISKVAFFHMWVDVKKLRLQSVEVRRASVGQYGLVTTDGVTVLSRSLNGRPSWTLATFYGVTTQSKMKSNGVASTSEVRLFFS